MSYQVLARKWRPRNFQAIVGQEHILRMLTNALADQRLHHAYLLTGTRGVGKTTLGRILAKCLNCEKGITATPCEQCSACVAIDNGKFLDLLEIDAASRTKVEDTRELLENVQYAPSQGRFKIYLIDEVHMLSGHSFNALLKTLEEPPAHVKFLLATTDPKRLPITILSRCLQFNLKRVPIEQISQHLAHICQSEGITFDEAALMQLADAADGSLRDALSLLDQAIAFCQKNIGCDEVHRMLGTINQDYAFQLLNALANRDASGLLAHIKLLHEQAPDFDQVLKTLLATLHQISVTQALPTFATDAKTQALANKFSKEETQLYYQIALIGRKDLHLAANPKQGFEMVMLRMLAFHPTQMAAPTKPEQKIPSTAKKETVSPPPSVAPTNNWQSWLSQLNLSGMTFTLAANCALQSLSDDSIELALSHKHESFLSKNATDRLKEALQKHFGKPLKLQIHLTKDELETAAKKTIEAKKIKHATAVETIQNDAQVQKIMDVFDATIDVNSIHAIEE